ncbi:DinB family protein [Cohnella endophytica]|uniref:DinB family protein n=1 Tax=Cohnella endophytica TaxID=2419778 RepID=A0A494Y5N6_9BACL|nr:DinB family protein [Cohnella endophytica]RKP58007.1 DinB family protein [Cohnella endophytica]
MTKIEMLLQGWDVAYGKEDWYPPFSDVLSGVTVEQALWKPTGEHVNTIWETLNHLLFYKERFLNRLTGEEAEYPAGVTNDDTFVVPTATDEEWTRTQERFKAVHLGIREKLVAFTEEQVEEKIPQTKIAIWLQNLAMHDAYHLGQIVFLRKLQGSWPSRRAFE